MTEEDKITELAQRLYTEDGHSGNVYKKATPQMLRFYENKAQEIIERREKMAIAWGALLPIQIAQLLHCQPHLRADYEQWKGGKIRCQDIIARYIKSRSLRPKG